MRIQSGKWGDSGKNGGEVTLNAKNQKIEGNIYVDSISDLEMNLSKGSSYLGSINEENTAKTLSLTLDSSSNLTLTGDTYITSLNNEVSDNSNINLNGHKLYVNGEALTSTSYNSNTNNDTSQDEPQNNENQKLLIISLVAGVTIIAVILITLILKKKKK